MLEIKDGKKILTTPISSEDLADIHAGDIVYLNGSMTTCRDVAHRRLVEEGRELPVNVRDAAIFHAGPIIRPLDNDKFEMVSVGPTTSMRMEKFSFSAFLPGVCLRASAANIIFCPPCCQVSCLKSQNYCCFSDYITDISACQTVHYKVVEGGRLVCLIWASASVNCVGTHTCRTVSYTHLTLPTNREV